MQRWFTILLLACLISFPLLASGEQTPLDVAQRLFDAMSARDASAARALFIPEAMLFSVSADGSVHALPFEKWLAYLANSKDHWLERIWEPKIHEHGSIATVWADYDFHLNGKFSHCGIDSFQLVKTNAGWRIASISDTRETSGCSPSPLGLPAK